MYVYQLGGVRVSFRGCMIIVDLNEKGLDKPIRLVDCILIINCTTDSIKAFYN